MAGLVILIRKRNQMVQQGANNMEDLPPQMMEGQNGLEYPQGSGMEEARQDPKGPNQP